MVYKDCDVGSAKPSKELLKKYPHHLIDHLTPNEIFTAADFCKYSMSAIKNAHIKKKLPVFVGGSMMYFKSLFYGMHNLPERDQELRDKLKSINDNYYLFSRLKEVDPNYAKTLNKNDETRIIRALEVYEKTGKRISYILDKNLKNNLSSKFNVFQFCLNHNRDIIHSRIKKRLNKIIDHGLINEAKELARKYDISENHPIKKSINYKQAFDYLEKKYDYETFFSKALYATRQLAKRQNTWIRNWEKFTEIDPNIPEIMENSVKKLITTL